MKHSMKRLWLEENKLTQQSPQVYQICKQMTIINGEISLVQICKQMTIINGEISLVQICKQMTIINGEISLVQIFQQTTNLKWWNFTCSNYSTNDGEI